ncbi:DMT family transporter [Oceanobacillus oncorhynchi subsp. oncorhynchi]|uniref:DMT family transporter n=1 Tax=Oceanobacillus oncorhynchi TaxID=545501 RepID=UPI0031CEADCD
MEERNHLSGFVWGMLGVLCFSLTLPATNVAVQYFNSIFVGLGRTIPASLLAVLFLIINKQPVPAKKQFRDLFIIAFGAVLIFPLLTTYAMADLPVSHGAVELALLPLATAFFAMIIANERPGLKFWIASSIASLSVIIYAFTLGLGTIHLADMALIVSVIILGLSYAMGAKLAKEIGSWQTIAWSVIIGAPLFFIPVIRSIRVEEILAAPISGWVSFIYLAVISQFLAYIFWYKGLSVGGISKVSQLQYLQPFLMITFSFLFLNEVFNLYTIIIAVVTVSCVIIGKNAA